MAVKYGSGSTPGSALCTTRIASASAFAKTEGSYVGLDLHRAVAAAKYNNNTAPSAFDPTYESSKTGLGVQYKYAFNFDKIFVAPGLFYESINTVTDMGIDEATAHRELKLSNRYGAKIDFGYDINDNLAAYVTGGVSKLQYSTNAEDGDGLGLPMAIHKPAIGYLYGFGLLTHLNKNWTLGAEYNTQKFNVKSVRAYHSTIHTNDHIKTRIDMYKFTVAYHF